MEGVAFASRRNIEIMKSRGNKLDRLVAAGGGAKTRLWLEIKASVYGCPILTPADPECGVLGCAMLAGVGAGIFDSIDDAVRRLVRYDAEIQPDPVVVGPIRTDGHILQPGVLAKRNLLGRSGKAVRSGRWSVVSASAGCESAPACAVGDRTGSTESD